MSKHSPNYRLAKMHRSYTVEEVARLYGIHRNTVRNWVREGLPACDNERPMLILGRELEAFLKARSRKNKRPCGPGEIYCVRCRAPKHPAAGMAEYRPQTNMLGNLVGICPDCEGFIFRRVNMTKIDQVKGGLDVAFPSPNPTTELKKAFGQKGASQ